MTLAPSTTMDATLLGIYASRFEVSTGNPAAIAWLHGVYEHATITNNMPVVGVDLAPFDGTPIPMFIDATAPVAPVTLRVVPTAPEPAPVPVVAQAPALEVVAAVADIDDADEAVKPDHYAVGWVQVMNEDLTHYKPEDAIYLARMRHFIENGATDLCRKVTDLEAALGLGRRSIKAKFGPGGVFSDSIVMRTEDGLPAHEWPNTEGDMCWRFDVLRQPTYKKDADGKHIKVKGKKVLASKADTFTMVPVSWLFQDRHTTGGVWTAQDAYALTTVWVACMVRLWACGRTGGVATSLGALTTMSHHIKTVNTLRAWHTTAERAGLITVTGVRDGKTASVRETHAIPVPVEQRTSRAD